jgi:hypothetical protein
MSNISTCLTLAEKMWSSDVDRVLEAIDAYLAAGFSQADAQRMAVDDLVAGIQAERVETEAAVREQHADLFDENLPAQPELEPVYFSDPAQWSRREFNREYMQPGAVVDTPAFQAWFGDSKVVDAQGKPLVVYHGTTHDFAAFRRKPGGRALWASTPDIAASYPGDSTGANVMPVYMSMQRPMAVDAGGEEWQSIRFEGGKVDTTDLTDIAEERGFDGVIITNLRDDNSGNGGEAAETHYAVLRPEQIKSAIGNAGTFDPDNADIRFSIRERMVDYLAARNKTLDRVNSADTLESDLDLAAKAIDAVRAEIEAGTASQTEIPLGPVPHVLHMLGAPMQMMQINTSIVRKILVDKHGADFSGVTTADFVRAIYEPAMVLQAQTKGEMELITSITNAKGEPVMFVVKSDMELPGSKAKAAAIKSGYARSELMKPGLLAGKLKAGQVRYANLAAVQALEEQSPTVARAFGRAPSASLGSAAWSGNKAGSHFPGSLANQDFLGQDRPGINLGAQEELGVGSDRLGLTSASVLAQKLSQSINLQSIKGHGDLVNFITDQYRGDWSQAPSFSRRTGRFSLRKFGIGAQFIENIQDRYNRWKHAIEDVSKQGGVVTEANDFYRAEERYWGKVGSRIEDFGGEMEQFVKDVAEDRLMLDDVALYAYALHAQERNDWIAAHRPGMPDGGSGMSTADANLVLAEAAASGLEPALARHAATLRQWIQGTRDILLNEGLIDQDNYDAWTNMFQMYVPLRGLEGAPDAPQGTGQGFNIRGQEGKRAFGRRSEARQIIEQIAQDRSRALIRAGKNEVLKSFAQFVLDNPSPNLWEVEAVETKPVERIDAMGNRIIDEEQRIISDDRTVTVKDAGREIHITVRDERLLAQLQNLHVENIGKFIGGLLWVNRLLGRLYTSLNPVFTVINGVRDLTAATIGVIDEIGFMAVPRLWANLPAAAMESFRAERGTYSPDYQLYRATGGKTGFFDFKTLDGQTRELQSMLDNAGRVAVDPRVLGPKLMAIVEAANGGIENATRLAAFKTSRQMGGSVADAASLAKNITVNFNRKGTMTPSLSAWFLFFNPAVQGTARVIQAVSHPKTLATLSMGMVGIAGLAMRNAGMGDDDDGVAWWDKIPSEVKERNLIVILPPGAKEGEPVPGSKIGRYVKIPMPYGYNFFAVLANQFVDVLRHDQDPRRGRGLGEAGMKAFGAFMGSWIPVQELGKSFETPATALMAAVPDALNPIAQTLANSNAFGRKLYPDDAQSKHAPDSAKSFPGQAGGLYQQAAESLNEATGGSKYRSGFIDVAPGSIEAIVRGYGGGPASFTLDVMNAFYMRLAIERPEVKTTALPFAKQLYGEIDAETDRLMGYERLEKARKIVEPFERAAKDGARDEVAGMRAEFGPMLRLGGAIQATQERLSEIRKRELSVIASETKTDSEKYVALMDMAHKRRLALHKFNEIYDRAIVQQDSARKPPAR